MIVYIYFLDYEYALYMFIAESFHPILDLNIFIQEEIGLMHCNVTN